MKKPENDKIDRLERLLELERAKNARLRRKIAILRDKIRELIADLA